MAERQAIRLEGKAAESAFRKLVRDSRASDEAKRGDVIVPVDGVDHYVEVKECHAPAGAGGTINQVRAIKFITCVVWAPNHGCWYVLSPDQLVRLAATKSRGQHTEIPFESMNFTLASLGSQFHSKATDATLDLEVRAAIRRGQAAGELGRLMTSLLGEIRQLRERWIEKVRDADPLG
jgi:hypothetical protein